MDVCDVGGIKRGDKIVQHRVIKRFHPGRRVAIRDEGHNRIPGEKTKPLHIFSFEPNPSLADKLKKRPDVQANKTFVHIRQEAVGGKNGSMTLHVESAQDQAASKCTDTSAEPDFSVSAKASIDRSSEVKVPVRGIQDSFGMMARRVLAPTENSVTYAVAINCEGCEYEILEALLQTTEVRHKQVKFVGVSWHLLSPFKTHELRVQKRCSLEKGLEEAGFRKNYNSYFGWQGWELAN